MIRKLACLTALCLLLSALCAPASLAARASDDIPDTYYAPVYQGVRDYVEPGTGLTVRVRLRGDERFDFLTDENDNVLVVVGGYLHYVTDQGTACAVGPRVTEQSSAPSGRLVRYGDAELRRKLTALMTAAPAQAAPNTYLQVIPDDYDVNAGLGGLDDAAKGAALTRVSQSDIRSIVYPPKGAQCPLLVLQVGYGDAQPAFSPAELSDRIFDNGVSAYYSTVSNGQFTYARANEAYGAADGVVRVDIPVDAPLFRRGEPTNANYNDGIMAGLYLGGDGLLYSLYSESSVALYAMMLADAYVDYESYDTNGDKIITPTELAILVVCTGYEAADIGGASVANGKPAVWAHSATLSDYRYDLTLSPNKDRYKGSYYTLQLDNVQLFKYTLAGEGTDARYDYYAQTGTPALMTIGTVCHELGHDLGLMDLYNTTENKVSKEVGLLSVMAYGIDGLDPRIPGARPGSLPVHFDPHSKIFLGFYKPDTITKSGVYRLNPTEPTDRYNILRINTNDPKVYYLVENRQFSGYDLGMFPHLYNISHRMTSGGIVVWRIDDHVLDRLWSNNQINCYEDYYGIMPVYADDANTIPFWGGQYIDLGDTLTLPETSGVKLSFFSDPPDANGALLLRVTLESGVPKTGDGAHPLLWALSAAAALGMLCALLLRRRVRKG